MQSEPNSAQLQALLDRATAGDDRALGELLTQASQRLYRLTRRMLNHYPRLRRWEQTDDVFQSAVLRLYRSLGEVSPQSLRQFFGLASTHIRRTLIDLARHHFGPQGQGAHHHSDVGGRSSGDVPGVLAMTADGEGDPVTLAAWAEFHEAVESLPDDEREVLSLDWYAGLAQSQIAALLGISVATVQRRLYRARHSLHRRLQGEPRSRQGD